MMTEFLKTMAMFLAVLTPIAFVCWYFELSEFNSYVQGATLMMVCRLYVTRATPSRGEPR